MTAGYALRLARPSRGSISLSKRLKVEACSDDIDLLVLGDTGTEFEMALVGNVFDRFSLRSATHDDLEGLIESDDPMHELLHRFWGRYIAFSMRRGEDDVTFFRDPSGMLPCYWMEQDDDLILASDAARLFAMGGRADGFDWTQIVAHLKFPGARLTSTCLAGVSELLPGQLRRSKQKGEKSATLWWPSIDLSTIFEPPDLLEDRLRREIQNVMASWLSRFPTPLLSLSGGLDSSILASCVGSRRDAVACLNLVSGVGRGDEREFARAVAEMHGLNLLEAVVSSEAIDPACSAAVAKPRPLARAFTQGIDAVTAKAAQQFGACAYFGGGGGDNIFAYLHSSLPAVDCLLDTRSPWTFGRKISDLAAMTGVNMWQIARRAIWRTLRSRSRFDPRHTVFLLSAEAADPVGLEAHPWIGACGKGRPGKQAHVAAVLEAIHFSEYLNIEDVRPTIYPLLSQPVVQICLSVPTWLWSRQGRDRSLARDAFRRQLPQAVLERRIKGSFRPLVERMVFPKIDFIRTLILEGELAGRNIIDRPRCEAVLSKPDTLSEAELSRLVDIIDVEAWIQSWRKAASSSS